MASAAIGSHAAGSAADKEVAANAPYVQAGDQDLSRIQEGLSNGTFGPGSIAPFSAPTLADAENTPGYQFVQQEGNRGILQGSAAMGGAISGGTLKSLANYDTGLANSTYNDRFAQAMQTYQSQLASQNQAYQQLLIPTQLGQASAINTGNAQAAGTVGTANAITGGLSSLTNGLTQTALLTTLLRNGGLGGGTQNQAATPTLGTASDLGMSQPLSATPMPQVQIPTFAPGTGPG